MPSKGASDLNRAEKERQIQERLAEQINQIKALIRQNVTSHIPQEQEEEIDILGIDYKDYISLGEVDYKGANCVVHYARKTRDEEGNAQIEQEYMVFSLDEEGRISGNLAKAGQDGSLELDDAFKERVENAKNGQLVRAERDKKAIIVKDGKTEVVSEEEKALHDDAEKVQKQEILENYRKMRGESSEEGRAEEENDRILSITELDDPTTIGKVLEIPLDNVPGKYKLVRFREDIFILVDDQNNIKAGIEISDLARDIHRELNIRPEDVDARIKAEDLEVASTVEGRYNIIKIRNEELDDTEVMLSYSLTGDSEVHMFERNANGDLKPVKTNQTYPPKIREDGQENNIVPIAQDIAKLKVRQEKLEQALALQKTIEAYEGKSHIPEALSGAASGVLIGASVGIVTVGDSRVSGTIGGVKGAADAYQASKAEAEETVASCREVQEYILEDLGLTISEAELEAKTLEEAIGKANQVDAPAEGRTMYSDAEDRNSRY